MLHEHLGQRLRRAAGVALLGALAGCSLLKIQMPGEPLSKRDLSVRLGTREFADTFVETVRVAADGIAARTTNAGITANAIRWKLGATAAARQSALRTAPVPALVDTWSLSRQMHEFIGGEPGARLLGAEQTAAVTNAAALERGIVRLARSLLPAAEFKRAESFIADYARAYPLKDFSFDREPVASRWAAFEETGYFSTVGTTSEAISDLADRLKAIGQQVPDELRWRMDLQLREMEPVFVDRYEISRDTGSFILMDVDTRRTVAAGMVREVAAG